MTDYVTAILKLKPQYDADPDTAVDLLAQWSNDTYGEGGLPGDAVFENRLGFVNTTVSNRYLRTRIGTAYGMAMEWIEESGGNPIAELVRVEWRGQDMVDTDTVDEDGNAIYEKQLFQTGTQDVTDEQGTVIDTVPVYLPRCAE